MHSQTKTHSLELLSGQKLAGYRVENHKGEVLGRMEDVMIRAEDGRVAYAVVSFGGVLRLGNKLFAFPWSALRVDIPGKKVLIDTDRKTLAAAHGFDKNHWPDSSSWDRDNGVLPLSLSSAVTPSLPVPSALQATETEPPEGKRIDHWGERWESHGLDRR